MCLVENRTKAGMTDACVLLVFVWCVTLCRCGNWCYSTSGMPLMWHGIRTKKLCHKGLVLVVCYQYP